MAFWDASALVPLCVHLRESASVRRLAGRDRWLTVWWGTPVELFSALARLLRQGALTGETHASAVKRLERLRTVWYEVPPGEEVRRLAEELPERYGLRALDAFQLAAALVWCGQRPRGRQFVCFDQRLGEAASRMGFAVVGDRPWRS